MNDVTLRKYRNQALYITRLGQEDILQSGLNAGFSHIYASAVNVQKRLEWEQKYADNKRIYILPDCPIATLHHMLPVLYCPVTFWVDVRQYVEDETQLLNELSTIALHRTRRDVIIIQGMSQIKSGIDIRKFILDNMDVRYDFSYSEEDDTLTAACSRGGEDYMFPRAWTAEQLDFMHSIISTEALAMLLMERIHMDTSASVIRMADGERAIIECTDPNHTIGAFLADPNWIKSYGLDGCDLRKLGWDLLWAGKEADFLSVPISGLYLQNFEMASLFPGRKFIDQFYPRMLLATGRVHDLLREVRTIVLHHDAQNVALALARKHRLAPIDYFTLAGWKYHDMAMHVVAKSQCKVVLMSGGPSGKPLAVRMARELNKIVLDIGSEMTYTWTSIPGIPL